MNRKHTSCPMGIHKLKKYSQASLLFILAALFLSPALIAQRNLTLFHMHALPQANSVNPGFIPEGKWFVGLPGVSNINFGASSSGSKLNQFGIQSLSKFGEQLDFRSALFSILPKNNAVIEANVDLLNVGFKLNKGYFSIGLSDQVEGQLKYSDELIILAAIEQGNEEDLASQYDSTFNLSKLNFNASHYRTLALGYALPIGEKFTIGAKVKFLMGLENIWTDNHGLKLMTSPTPNADYIVENRLDILSAGLNRFSDREDFSIANYFLNPGNYGLAFDIGGTFQFDEKNQFQFSLVNLGMIRWSNRVNYTVLNGTLTDPEGYLEDTWDNLVEQSAPSTISYFTPLAPQVYMGGKHQLSDKQSIGYLINAKLYRAHPSFALSASYNLQLNHAFGVTASYSAYNQNYTNFGLGLSLKLGPVQLYTVTDNLLGIMSPTKVNNAHFNAGINLLFGVKRKEPPMNEIANNTILPQAESEDLAAELEQIPYYTIRGEVKDRESGNLAEYIYVDVYKIFKDGRRELVRTRAFPGGKFEQKIDLSKAQHEIVINSYGYKAATYQFKPIKGQLLKVFSMDRDPDTNIAPIALERPADKGVNPKGNGDIIRSSFSLIQRTSLRNAPNSTSTVLKRVAVGTEMKLLEKTNNQWWKVSLEGQSGWIKAALLQPAD